MNSPIFRTELTNLFSKHLVCDLKGQHWLITPSEVCRVEVDDAPFIAVELTLRNPGLKQLIEFRTNVDTLFVLGPTACFYPWIDEFQEVLGREPESRVIRAL